MKTYVFAGGSFIERNNKEIMNFNLQSDKKPIKIILTN